MSNLLTIVTTTIAAAISLTSCGSPGSVDVAQEDTFAAWREPLYTSAKKVYIKANLDPLAIPAIAGCYVDGVINWLRANNCPNVTWNPANNNEAAALSRCLVGRYDKAIAAISNRCVAKFTRLRVEAKQPAKKPKVKEEKKKTLEVSSEREVISKGKIISKEKIKLKVSEESTVK